MLGGTTFMTVVMSRGIISAVPAACSTRPPSSTGKMGASAATRVPPRKNTKAVIKTCRVVSRSITNPVVGITTAMVSMKPVVSHCAVAAVTPKLSMMTGSATDSVVSFSSITVAASTRVPSTSLDSLVSPGLSISIYFLSAFYPIKQYACHRTSLKYLTLFDAHPGAWAGLRSPDLQGCGAAGSVLRY